MTAAEPEIWIRADTNRDGRIDDRDEAGKDRWTAERGAIFLANIDDDGRRFVPRAPDGRHLTDVELASCNDAGDEVVNGDDDVDDLAKLLAKVPADARSASVTVDAGARDRVRLFVAAGDGRAATDWSVLPPDASLVVGDDEPTLLGIEARDIVRDSSWDGRCSVTLAVECADGRRVTDSVALKVAPLLFVHDLLALEVLYGVDNVTSVFPGEAGFAGYEGDARVRAIEERIERSQAPFRADVLAGIAKAGLGPEAVQLLPNLDFRPGDPELEGQIQWAADFTGGSLGQTGVDIWPQDIMQPAFMSMPRPAGSTSCGSGFGPPRATPRAIARPTRCGTRAAWSSPSCSARAVPACSTSTPPTCPRTTAARPGPTARST